MVTKIADLIPQMIKVRTDFDSSRQKYMIANPNFLKEKDMRITFYSRYISTFDVALLYFMFRTFQLPSDSWWSTLPSEFRKQEISPTLFWTPGEDDRLKIVTAVDNYWSFSLFIMLFGILESSVRAIVRIAYPTKYNDGRAEITQIFRALLSANYSKYEKFLELFRLCRNTSHNNGVYFPDRKGNRDLEFKGNTYHFIDRDIVELGDVPKLLFFDIIPELLEMIDEIVNSADISKHDEIIDPSTK